LAPACAASGDSAATIPLREITIDRPCERSCASLTWSLISIAAPLSTNRKTHSLREIPIVFLRSVVNSFELRVRRRSCAISGTLTRAMSICKHLPLHGLECRRSRNFRSEEHTSELQSRENL